MWAEEDRNEADAISSDIRNDTDVCLVPSSFLGRYDTRVSPVYSPVREIFLKSERKPRWNDLVRAEHETL